MTCVADFEQRVESWLVVIVPWAVLLYLATVELIDCWLHRRVRGGHEKLESATKLIEQIPDPVARGSALLHICAHQINSNLVDDLEEGLAQFRTMAPRAGAMMQSFVPTFGVYLRAARGERVDATDIETQMSLAASPFVAVMAQIALMESALRHEELDGCIGWAEEILASSQSWKAAAAKAALAEVALRRSQTERALDLARESLEFPGMLYSRVRGHSVHARALAALGRHEEALAVALEGRAELMSDCEGLSEEKLRQVIRHSRPFGGVVELAERWSAEGVRVGG